MSHSQGHGRYESRTCYVCEDIGWLEGREKWSGLTGIGVIFCKVEQAGKVSKQAHYFIYNRKGMTASQILEAKRNHWSIEKQLHWVLDTQFREDGSRVRTDNSAENLNVLRQWAYNLLKSETSLRGGFFDKQFSCLVKAHRKNLCKRFSTKSRMGLRNRADWKLEPLSTCGPDG